MLVVVSKVEEDLKEAQVFRRVLQIFTSCRVKVEGPCAAAAVETALFQPIHSSSLVHLPTTQDGALPYAKHSRQTGQAIVVHRGKSITLDTPASDLR